MEAPPTFNDIVLPAAPAVTTMAPEPGVWPWLAAMTVALLTLVWLLRRWWLLRHLRRIQHDWRDGVYDNRDTVFLLAAQVARQAGVAQLTADSMTTEPARLQSRWHVFVRLLDRVRYERGELDQSDVDAVLQETRFWLLHVRRLACKKLSPC